MIQEDKIMRTRGIGRGVRRRVQIQIRLKVEPTGLWVGLGVEREESRIIPKFFGLNNQKDGADLDEMPFKRSDLGRWVEEMSRGSCWAREVGDA